MQPAVGEFAMLKIDYAMFNKLEPIWTVQLDPKILSGSKA